MTVKIPHTVSSSNVTLPLQTFLILSDSRNPFFCIYIPFFNSTHQTLSKFTVVYLFLLPVCETIPLFSYFSGKLRIFNRYLLKESSSLQLWGEQGILKLLKNIYISSINPGSWWSTVFAAKITFPQKDRFSPSYITILTVVWLGEMELMYCRRSWDFGTGFLSRNCSSPTL